ncbi:MAG: hypothetical protein H6Q80_1980 [Deltaproteobacteria bacterium]|jgi:hypothetical protein|nr:hypothetical protein [Deltaproteobacteria bacterium]
MKRKSLFPAVACTTVLLLVAFSHVRGDSPRPGTSPAGRVTIDGKSFLPGDPDQDDFSAVRREFDTFGLEAPPEFAVPAGNRPEHPVFRGRVVGVESPPSGDTPALPRGLTAEHTIRLESPAGPVDLVLGRMNGRGASVRDRLAADGWDGPGQAETTGPPWMLEKRNGKETAVVFLDEAEGTFLLFRETGR